MDTDTQQRIGYYRIEVAARMVGLRPAQIRRHISSGLVSPPADERGSPLLGEPELARLRKIRRLSTDLGLNVHSLEIVLRLLDQIEALQAEVNSIRKRS